MISKLKKILIYSFILNLLFISLVESKEFRAKPFYPKAKSSRSDQRKLLSGSQGSVFEPFYPGAANYSQKQVLSDTGSFQNNLFTGSAGYNYSIEVPPGINGLTPNPNLNYDSSQAVGRADWLGLGWILNLSYIQRNVEYTPDNTNDDTFDLILHGSKYDLVYISREDRYHTKIESHLWIKKISGSSNNQKGEYWVVRDKNGKEYRFGYNADSENISSRRDPVWRWSLDQIEDTNNNKIFFSYYENYSSNDIGAVYPFQIRYNNDQKRLIEFVLEDSDRSDSYIFYEQGSKVRKTRRLKEIKVYIDGDLIRKYMLNYTYSPTTNRSLLKSITQFGSDDASSLPPTIFNYQVKEFGFEGAGGWPNPGGRIREGNETYTHKDTFDINRDGFVDYIGNSWEVSINDGNSFGQNINWQGPGYNIRYSEFLSYYDTFDINGDNLPDFIYASGNNNWSVNLNNGNAFSSAISWSAPKGYIHYTTEDFDSLTMYDTFDINGDSLVDFIESNRNGSWNVYLNNGNGFNSAISWLAPPYYISEFETPIEYGPGECAEDCDQYCDDTCDESCDSACRVACEDCEDEYYDYCFYDWCYDEYEDDDFCDSYCRESADEECSDCEDDCYDEHCWAGDWYHECEHDCHNECEDACQDVYIPAPEKYTNIDTFDINGDGLPDLVDPTSSSNWNVYLNNGNGFDNPISWPAVSSVINYSFAEEGNYRVHKGIIDINGDSLPDFVDRTNDRVYLNNGNGFNISIYWFIPRSWIQSGEFFTTFDKFLDLNGDGLLDFVTSGWNVYLNKLASQDLLINITNSSGGTTAISYSASNQYDNTGTDNVSDLGFIHWCVSSVTKDNGMSGVHNTSSIYNYEYANGLYDYDDKEFRGFGYVKVIEPTGDYNEYYFHQDDALKGKLYRIEQKDSSGNIYAVSEYTWSYETIHTQPENVCFAFLTQEDELSYDGTTENPKIARVKYLNYDDYGNIEQIVYQGDMDISGDEKYLYNEYVYNTDYWIVDKLQHTYLNASDDTAKVKESWYAYDDGEIGDAPTKGNLTKQEDWLDTGDNPVTIYSYDEYGNQISITDAEEHTTVTTYDAVYHTFAVEVKNAKNQITRYTYDPATGEILTITDPNSFVTSYEYDIFKRLTKEIRPYDSSAYPTLSYQYFIDGTAPEGILVSKREISNQQSTLNIYTFIDGFGRTIQTKTESEDTTKQIVTDTFYNSQEEIDRISVPYFSNSSNSYTQADTSVRNISYKYDPIKRIIKITNTDGTSKTNNYSHWVTTTTNENGIPIEFTYDAYKRLIKVQEHNYGQVYTTTYGYDTQDNLIRITDDQNNQAIYGYDSLGRKINSDDPDRGKWSYTYDKVGKLISQTDANENTINFEYDELNRILKKDYPTGVDVDYAYDLETIGTLSQISDESGTTHYYYDNRKRKIKEERIIDSTTYTIEWSYDSMDRIINITYPDSEIISYTYNSQGKVENINSFLDNIDYNAQGNIILKEFANGIYTELTYNEDDFRLNRIYTPGLQDLSYEYDNVGNIIYITDNLNTASQGLVYDDLNRLIKAQGDIYGTINYDYDQIGNMTWKSDVHYDYGKISEESQFILPHALTSGTDGSYFLYDANGNTTRSYIPQIGLRSYSYDLEDRLIEVKSSENQIRNLNYELKEGWNLISFPYLSADKNILNVLSSLRYGADYLQICRYGPSAAQFEHFVSDSDFNDFDALDYNIGYEILVTHDLAFTVEGEVSLDDITYNLENGKNLISYAGSEEKAIEDALSDISFIDVYWYNPESNNFDSYNEGSLQNFIPGRSYFVEVTNPSSFTIAAKYQKTVFGYDGGGDRVKKQIIDISGDTTESITYIGSLFEKTTNYELETTDYKKYIFLENTRIATIKIGSTDKTYYYHGDHLNSSNIITDENGDLIQLCEYTPYGDFSKNEVVEQANITHYFTGKELDVTTDLYYYGARYYNPNIVKFITADTISPDINDPQTLNRFSYCLNNPLKYIDPTGEVPVDYAYDPLFLAMSWDAYESNPTFLNAVALGIDVALTAMPYVPAVGGISIRGLSKFFSKADDLGRAAKLADKTMDLGKGANKIVRTANRSVIQGKIVLGHYPDYIDMAGNISAKRFNIPQKIWNKMSNAEKWAANKKFLDRAIKHGDEIILSNPVNDINKVTGSFRKELDYLIKKGYKLSDDGSRIVR